MSKNIVICCDGTANRYGLHNSNVAKLYDMLPLSSGQIDFYDPGVGTTPHLGIKFLGLIKNIFAQATGADLAVNVQEAYSYLMSFYEPGDRVYLFGFSRGAHTVRRLAEVLGYYGILHRGNNHLIPYVLDMHNQKNLDEPTIEAFRSKFTKPCPVHFLGLWDTVSALSSLLSAPKLDGKLHSETAHTFHAVAIDEKRVKFPANLVGANSIRAGQTAEEVWFAGVHADVGGTQADSELANIPLRWLINHARQLGLQVDEEMIQSLKINPLAKMHSSWKGFFLLLPGPLYVLLLTGVLFLLSVRFSSLAVPAYAYAALFLFALALVPFTKKLRTIPPNAKIHGSVKVRMEQTNYRPKNLMPLVEKKEITWVD
jgi:uncharacterized protein (DUF2235 family)